MIKKTITSIFIVPTLQVPKGALKNNGFINGYIKDKLSSLDYEEVIFLLFKPSNLNKFKEFLDGEYERTKNVIDDYDYEKGYVVVVYKLDEHFQKDFKLVKQGKYSKTSKIFQSLFPRTVTIFRGTMDKEEFSLQYRIFNKTQDLVDFWEDKLSVDFDDDFEVWEGWDEEKEILNINELKEYI